MDGEISLYSLLRLIAALSILALGLFVLLRNKKSAINRSFFILTLGTFVWQFSYFIVCNLSDIPSAILWSKLTYLGVVFIPAALYHFIISFLNIDRKKLVYIFYIISSAFIFIVQSDYFLVGIKKFYWGYYPLVREDMRLVFLAIWMIPLVLCWIELYMGHRQSVSPYDKKRIKYFLITLPIVYLTIINYLPNYGITDIYPFGAIPLIFFIISTTYAIVRYRLIDIEIVVKKASLITIAFVVSLSLMYIGAFYLEPYFYVFLGKNWIVFPVLVSFLVSLGLFRFMNFVRHIEENELSKRFAYRPLLKKEAQRISTVRNIEELLIYITRDLSNWVRLDYVGVVVWNTQSKEFVLEKSLTRTKKRARIPLGLTLSDKNPLVVELSKKKRPLIYSEIEHYFHLKTSFTGEGEFFWKLIGEMKRLGAEISIPCFCEGRLLGMINIGHKLNPNEIITNEDIDLFSSLGNHVARAIYGFMLKEEKIQLIVASQNILISAIEAKDRYTRGHTDRVAHYSDIIGRRLEKQLRAFPNGLSNLIWAALLHDLGKISIPDAILLKNGPLDKEEWDKIKEHPLNGVKIIKPVQEWLGDDICAGICHHHENYDGTGYPAGQKEDGIHFFARVIRVADAFDAMTTDRPYSPALSKEDALKELNKYKSIYFDPLVVEIMEDLCNSGEIDVK